MTRSDRTSDTSHAPSSPLRFRSAVPTDGTALWRLVQAAGTLELNSAYCYLLFATDFGSTCLVAEQDGETVGAVIGYHPPQQPQTAFVWQVAVLPRLRGKGLGAQLLGQWRALPANRDCRWVTATVAEGNLASQALFRRFAATHQAACEATPHFTADLFPGEHPPEPLLRIGPLERALAPETDRVATAIA
ncbi:diaminobutyrate acetyltransferase [Hydrogenophaga sp.]|uniref:diaminobutyrate acetyltransferase n=1 Tax=Hydrogenophaga sp. TaxID=1904254 RepID=UPI0025BA8BB9|nr:diaminobutyrate acetyltransferase [Hydrogenophaga sp.]